jgi:hypothetical protein
MWKNTAKPERPEKTRCMHTARWVSEAPYTLSVKLSDYNMLRHTWRKNWVNWAVLTGNSAGLKTVISSRISHIELRSSLRESHSFLSLPADTTMTSQGTTLSSNSFSRWASHDIYVFANNTSYSTFYAFFSSFRITLWPMWLANSKQQPWLIHHSHTRKKTHRTDKKTDKPCGKPVLCQRTFSSVFRAVFIQLNCTV